MVAFILIYAQSFVHGFIAGKGPKYQWISYKEMLAIRKDNSEYMKMKKSSCTYQQTFKNFGQARPGASDFSYRKKIAT